MWSIRIILAGLTFLSFSPVLTCSFTNWDDPWMMLNNPLIRSLAFSNLKEMFFGDLYMMNYQPLVFLSYATEYHFFGMNPLVFHLTNVILHVLNVLLVYRLISLLANDKIVALITAVLFAVHPMRVESVAWVTGRRDMLYAFFYLLSLVHYILYIKSTKGAVRHFFFAVVFFILSCLSKGMAVSLPLVILLIDYFLGRKVNWKFIKEKIPFFILAAAFGTLAVYATHNQKQLELYDVYTLPERLLFACYGALFYIYKLLLPFNLSAFHPYPSFKSGEIPVYFFLFPLIILLIAGLSVYSIRFSRKTIFGIVFFIVALVMVLQVIPVYNGLVAERYTYIAYLGLFYLAGEGSNYLYQRFAKSGLKNILFLLGIIAVIYLSLLTFQRTKIWKNSEALWSDVIKKYPSSPAGYLNRGQYYSETDQMEKALADFTTVINIKPNALAFFNRGNIFAKQKQYNIALSDYNTALELNPDYCEVFMNRGLIYYFLRQFENSVYDYSKNIACNPGNGAAYLNRSLSMMESGDHENALQDALMARKLGQKVNEKYIKNLLRK